MNQRERDFYLGVGAIAWAFMFLGASAAAGTFGLWIAWGGLGGLAVPLAWWGARRLKPFAAALKGI